MKKMAIMATLHCLLGCAIGELIGLELGYLLGLETHWIIALSVALSFISGYAVSTIPLVRSGLKFWPSLKLVFAADTLSILTMTIVDNTMMVLVPGAMDKDLTHPMYWASRLLSFAIAFVVAVPVNYWLLRRGKGHALTHQHMGHENHSDHEHHESHHS